MGSQCQQHSPASAALAAVDATVGKKRLSNKLAGYQIKARLMPHLSIAPFMQEWEMDFVHTHCYPSDVVLTLLQGRETEAMS